MPTVSVLIPIYNTNSQYLRECVESINKKGDKK